MKPSPHPLRFFVIAFFLFMIAGPVLYRCGVFKKQEQTTMKDFNPWAESMAQPWFDSTAFRKLIINSNGPKMYSSKSGPAFSSHPLDSLTVLELLEMRYAAPRMSATDAATFAALGKRLNHGERRWFNIALEPEIQDSISIYFYVIAGSNTLSNLPEAASKIVQKELNRLSDSKLNEGKTPYLGLNDTLNALKTLRIEKLKRPIK